METGDKVFAALIGLAIIAVVVSQGSNTAGSITGLTTALVSWIGQLMSPLAATTTTSTATPTTANTVGSTATAVVPSTLANSSIGNMPATTSYAIPVIPSVPMFSGTIGATPVTTPGSAGAQ